MLKFAGTSFIRFQELNIMRREQSAITEYLNSEKDKLDAVMEEKAKFEEACALLVAIVVNALFSYKSRADRLTEELKQAKDEASESQARVTFYPLHNVLAAS